MRLPILRFALLACILGGAACSSPRTTEVARLQYQLNERSRQLESLRTELDQQAAPLPPPQWTDPGTTAATGPADDGLLPPNAQPGECYARVMTPATYRTVTEQVLVQDASEEIEVIPAAYEWVEEEVVVKEASERIEVIPAEYQKVEEQVIVTPASTRVEEVPAVYEWVEEQVLIQPAHTVWQKGTGPIQRVDNATGEIMCLVEVPARYETVRKRKLVQPATSRSVEVPAEYRTIERMVMVQPATTRTVTLPAETTTVRVQRMVQPEERRTKAVPPEFRTVTKEVIVFEGGIGWERVLCETNLSQDIIRAMQEALAAQGIDPGPVDGVLGPRTHAALQKYQTANNLAVGGLTYETLQALGIEVAF